jgi:hypothetical protein
VYLVQTSSLVGASVSTAVVMAIFPSQDSAIVYTLIVTDTKNCPPEANKA